MFPLRGRRPVPLLLLACSAFLTACGDGGSLPLEPEAPDARLGPAWGDPTGRWAPAPSSDVPVLVGAGDIADCGREGDSWTAALLDGIEGTVVTFGDNALPNGSFSDYTQCYHPTWGRHYDRTLPSPGNHDYLTPAAAGYFWYFRERAGPPGLGFYSYDLGGWHVVVLNSMLEWGDQAIQRTWLTQDLARSSARCTVAYFHHPRFSSGLHGKQGEGLVMQAVWTILYRFGVEIVLSGHDHHYERFAPQDALGNRDEQYGVRQFVVGVGGNGLRPVAPPTLPNSEYVQDEHHGVIRLDLEEDGYRWEFIATDGTTSWTEDAGEGSCHGPPPVVPAL